MVWVLYVKRAVATVLLLMQLEREWIVLRGLSVVCEACRHHYDVIDAAGMRIRSYSDPKVEF